jgi:hypothetical protein
MHVCWLFRVFPCVGARVRRFFFPSIHPSDGDRPAFATSSVRVHMYARVRVLPCIPLRRCTCFFPLEGGDLAEDGGEIKTIFLSGLPQDCTEREIRGLFRTCGGFEFASLRGVGGKTVCCSAYCLRQSIVFRCPSELRLQPVAFVGFSDANSAIIARDSIQVRRVAL